VRVTLPWRQHLDLRRAAVILLHRSIGDFRLNMASNLSRKAPVFLLPGHLPALVRDCGSGVKNTGRQLDRIITRSFGLPAATTGRSRKRGPRGARVLTHRENTLA